MKAKIIKDYKKLDKEFIKLLKKEYPFGFEENLVTFNSINGEKIWALPYETENASYLIKMGNLSARAAAEEDDDDDDEFTSTESLKDDDFKVEGADDDDDSDLDVDDVDVADDDYDEDEDEDDD